MRLELRFQFLPLNIISSLIDFKFFRMKYPWRNSNKNGRSTFSICSVPLWDILSSQTSFYFGSALFSLISQIWRWQVCFFRERKAVRSRKKYAVFCGENLFGITITNIYIELQHIGRLATSIWWRCVQNQPYSFSHAAFHPLSRDLVTKILINQENLCVDKHSIQMLRLPVPVSLVQDGTVRNTWFSLDVYTFSTTLTTTFSFSRRQCFYGNITSQEHRTILTSQVNCVALLARF